MPVKVKYTSNASKKVDGIMLLLLSIASAGHLNSGQTKSGSSQK